MILFLIAGLDQNFHRADAEIRGDTVVVKCEAVPEPVAVRYAWEDSPFAKLWNKDGLPTGTFRCDIWPLQTQRAITTPLILTEGGTADEPAIFDGQGMVIDLGIDVGKDGFITTIEPQLVRPPTNRSRRVATATLGK
jgi:hypothetical protein